MSGVPKVVFHKWWRDAWKQCDALFVHTEGLRQTLRQFLDSEDPPIVVTPHGITEMLKDLPEQSAVPQSANLRHLLFFGVVAPNKGLHVLLQAMRELPEFRLTIAGDFKEASYKRKILDQITQLPKEQIRLIDRFVDDDEIPELFALSSLVVLPYTFFHAQSGVLQLAMKYGTPAVVSDLGGIGETVHARGIGECVTPNNPRALAEAIRRIAELQRYRAAKGAIEKTRGELSWKNTAELTWQAYLSVLGA
jgi:glycosyltransferase involved in cell wall biosynthesis